jgi:hypothetical protein
MEYSVCRICIYNKRVRLRDVAVHRASTLLLLPPLPSSHAGLMHAGASAKELSIRPDAGENKKLKTKVQRGGTAYGGLLT